ncbi:putative trans-2-enoyl-CoA reductase, mitochondrial [Smittium mucronatum]|uniref:Putative trans-2-enoyl-CoA reductase, mitochondrial n=1 Tax=Smittium mucronatum TaxID=133383 RepID=A0A1R0H586_9FUNG|nr:putative trans-2-enoyl-CoA reductase, mitochondrial [Smittium mucronatum]
MPSQAHNLARAAIFNKAGEFKDNFEVYDIALGDLPADRILVENMLSSVNPSDMLRSIGIYPVPVSNIDFDVVATTSPEKSNKVNGNIVGLEGVSRVVKIGSNVKGAINGDIAVGDWVIPFDFHSYGSWSTHAVLDPMNTMVIKNTNGLTADDIVSARINGLTGYRMLKDIIELKPGDYIIQNGANSGAGQYIIQFAHLSGYKTINVIRDRGNFEQISSMLRYLGADIIIKDTELESETTKKLISELSGPLKLGFNCIGGKSADNIANLLCHGGTMVTYGAMTFDPITSTAPQYIFNDLRLRGYWMNNYFNNNPSSEWVKSYDAIFDLMRSGKIKSQHNNYIDMFEVNDGRKSLLELEKFKAKLVKAVESKEKVALRFIK